MSGWACGLQCFRTGSFMLLCPVSRTDVGLHNLFVLYSTGLKVGGRCRILYTPRFCLHYLNKNPPLGRSPSEICALPRTGAKLVHDDVYAGTPIPGILHCSRARTLAFHSSIMRFYSITCLSTQQNPASRSSHLIDLRDTRPLRVLSSGTGGCCDGLHADRSWPIA